MVNVGKYIQNMSFVEAEDGTHIFYPYGSWGKGRVVASDEMFQKLLLHQYIWCALIGATTTLSLKLSIHVAWFIAAIWFPIVIILYCAATQIITRKLPYSSVRLRIDRKALAINLSVGPYVSAFMLLAGIVVCIVGAIIILSHKMTGDHLALGLAVVGLGMLSGGWGLRCIIKRNPQDIVDADFDRY